VVGSIINSVRPSDLVVRLGGEEFCVIMPETTVQLAHMVADRLRGKIAATPVPVTGKDDGLNVTVSIGVSQTIEANTDTQATLFERADAALYRAKNSGRNRVEVA